MTRRLWCCLAAIAVVTLAGCLPRVQPEEFFQLTEQTPARRAMQTRVFDTADEKELLSASAAVLQDLGFHVEEIVPPVGFVRGVKERSAREYGQDICRFLVMVVTFGYGRIAVDLHQQISAVVVTAPVRGDRARHEVRVVFYRVVWKGDGYVEKQEIPPGEQRMETIADPEIYQLFFAELSQALFLERFTL